MFYFYKYTIERDSIQCEILHIRFYWEGKFYEIILQSDGRCAYSYCQTN